MNTTPSLYTISGNLAALLSRIEDNGGELTPELEQALTITEEQFADKAADYGLAILNLKNMSEICASEIERLSELKKHYDNVQKRLSQAIAQAMQAFDRPKVETPTLRLSLRHTTATTVDDADLVPPRFKVTKVETVVNKTEIKKAIQAGEDVPGAHLTENVNLQIK